MGLDLSLSLVQSANANSTRFFQPNDIAGYVYATNPADPTCAVDDGTGSCLRLNDLYDKTLYIGAATGGFAPEITMGSGILGSVRLLRFNGGATADFMSTIYGGGANLANLYNLWNQSNFQTGNAYCIFAYRVDQTTAGGLDGVIQWAASGGTKLQYRISAGATPNSGISYVQTGQATQFITATGGTPNWEIVEISKIANTINIYVGGALFATGTVPVTSSMANTEFGLGWNPGPQAILNGYVAAQAYYTGTPTTTERARLFNWVQQCLIAPILPATVMSNSIGANVHFGTSGTPYVSRTADVVAALADIGIKHLREDLALQTAGGATIDPTAEYGRMNLAISSGGVQDFSVVCFDSNNGFLFTPPAALYGSWVQNGLTKPGIFQSLNGAVRFFEGSNEPNIAGNPTKAAASQQHQSDMWATYLANPQLAAAGVGMPGPSYVQSSRASALNATAITTLGNIHPYPGNEFPETITTSGSINAFIQGSRSIFSFPELMIASEDGYQTALTTSSGFLPVSEAMRARYLPRMLLWNFVSGIPATYIYEFWSSFDPTIDPTNIEAFFGLIAFDGTKTAGYGAVKGLLSFLNAVGTTGAPAFPGRVATYPNGNGGVLQTANFQRADGSNILAIWLGIDGWNASTKVANAPVSASVGLEFLSSASTVTAYRFLDDGTQTASTITLSSNQATVTVYDQLTLIVSAAVPAPPPALDLNFAPGIYAKDGTLYATPDLVPGWTFSRALAGYGQTAAGALTSFISGAPRITDQGLLIEAAATNVMLRSTDIGNAAWSTFITGAGTVTRTSNSAAAPDGTTTATLVAINRAVNTEYAQTYQAFTSTAVPWTGSIWLKGSTGGDVGKSISIWFYNGSTGLVGVTTVILTAGWVRYQSPITLPASAGAQFGFGYSPIADGGVTGTGAISFLVWGGQAELGSVATSTIATTTAAVTRPADALSQTFAGSPANETVTYTPAGIVTTPTPTSPLNLGASSAGAWVGRYVKRVLVQ